MNENARSDLWNTPNVWRVVKGLLWIIGVVAFAVIAPFLSTAASMFGKLGESNDRW